MDLKDLLNKVAAGELSVESAFERLGQTSERDLGFARIDVERHRRRGIPETIFCPGKTDEQIIEIIATLRDAGQNVLATRATPELYDAVRAAHPEAVYHRDARAITVDVAPIPPLSGRVAVVTAGTGDIPVAEEAALAAERMGARVERVYDVGVAGLHRLVKHLDLLKTCRAVVVVAGMEGALPSVVGGLIDRPIIAVPTSIGYSMNLGGITALLAMINSCVPGITVVNVDNGFGAGIAAAMINRVGESETGRMGEKGEEGNSSSPLPLDPRPSTLDTPHSAH
ncbi:MAG: nickel pincer cofactor biosynthesis protein LarB [Kiritimatiellae bacterium]|nr:nickel pincer cofactor biosynthesis protein LarB [Kiritimatiellia bacterium]